MTLASLRAELVRLKAEVAKHNWVFSQGKAKAFSEVIEMIDDAESEIKPLRCYEDKAPA